MAKFPKCNSIEKYSYLKASNRDIELKAKLLVEELCKNTFLEKKTG